jgi:sec-independent protein translocase protein TatA|tara:strand:+ start:730 stop:966 length:237 start_codon:yes stop_codon:yes gene_type:complete
MWGALGGSGKVPHMFGLGPTELIIVAGIVLLLFGTRLPRVMRSLGEGIVELKRGLNSSEEERISQPNGQGTETTSSKE